MMTKLLQIITVKDAKSANFYCFRGRRKKKKGKEANDFLMVTHRGLHDDLLEIRAHFKCW